MAFNQHPKNQSQKWQRGFSLIEISLVLIIAGLALGAGLAALGPQLQALKYSETQKKLQNISEATLAFAMANGRLPCPSTPTSNGLEAWCTNVLNPCGAEVIDPASPATGRLRGRCLVNNGVSISNGYVPARTLGLPDQSPDGVVMDSWGKTISYSVTAMTNSSTAANFDTPTAAMGGPCSNTSPCYPATQTNGLRNAYYNGTGWDPGLSLTASVVCSTATGIGIAACGSAATTVAAVTFVLVSTGRNGANPVPASPNEVANSNNDRAFVSTTRNTEGPAASYFDDVLLWVTPQQLLKRLVDAGVAKP
ncbi:MAG: prepilin-type N-terminal cleavage/methylation domain-containing protein [Ramlibacter sp.]|nr:prepilin-type N-terminal cleavage/methylation domain-containing protein [Ramlibacter sp.]